MSGLDCENIANLLIYIVKACILPYPYDYKTHWRASSITTGGGRRKILLIISSNGKCTV